ncbi:PREDICTED: nucleolar and coiled-body phosphoprotein 1-like [Camelina sativa]|uniref:Nucleolar and coiled-body phosphoprotein 1-like n=1 Tax=Camelina sativa TaxID=90675 RepID=A0ABM0UMN2_CAMSA|nr:PREDICTED: nucleolar and coiled-body phosphoprotein 1-like [Camelina sativa]
MGSESKTSNLESDQKALLLRSVAQFLERSGLSKCFKKLLSEAEIEKKELNTTSLPDLEEIFSEFLNKKKDQEAAVNGITEENAVEGVEDVKKEKKKKKKKETKVEVAEEEKVKETVAEVEEGLKEKKKKKKKSKSVEADDDDDKEKVSKKRKRSEPEETKEETEDDDEESKRRKKEEKVVEEDKGVQETPVKQTDIQENGNAEKSEAKSTNQKSGKGLSNSKEPKKPFQRVNVDEVVFTDERLKDNSYSEKSLYGYKAQEILGQVRGRDFRHEKTKKKRGSYRGGEIDLQSHSIKYHYSDDEVAEEKND